MRTTCPSAVERSRLDRRLERRAAHWAMFSLIVLRRRDG
jgi:hypothetical protein